MLVHDLDLGLPKSNLFSSPCLSDLHPIFMKPFHSAKDCDHDLELDHDLDLDQNLDLDLLLDLPENNIF